MRGIRIWHVAALALSVPFLAAAVPSGCTGGLNPNFVSSVLGGSAASASTAAPDGWIVLAFYNYTGYPGIVDFTVPGQAGLATEAFAAGLPADRPQMFAWACNQFIYEIDLAGGTLDVTDPTTNTVTQVSITYDGGVLGNSQMGDPLACGTVVTANVYLIDPSTAVMDVELVK